MTTDDTTRPDASAEAGEVDLNPEDQIPGQEALFPGLHGDGDGAQRLISPPSGKPLVAGEQPRPDEAIKVLREKLVTEPMALEQQPEDRRAHNDDEIPPRKPSPRPENPFSGKARGSVPLASMRESGFLDRTNEAEHVNRTVAAAIRADDGPPHVEPPEIMTDEKSFFRVVSPKHQVRGKNTGMPVTGIIYTVILPDGSVVEGGLQVPCAHEDESPHGRYKNIQLSAETIALAIDQLLAELQKRAASATAAFDAENTNCTR